LLFKIFRISHGWFEVYIGGEFSLINSNYLGCDAPMLLLEALCDMLEEKTAESWLCWQDEPRACILNIEKQDERFFMRIYNADKESKSLDYNGMSLSEHITECVYKSEEIFTTAVKNIVEEFSLYENGNGRGIYNAHWGEFPEQQYTRLKKLLRRK